jgi:hypothetical protein
MDRLDKGDGLRPDPDRLRIVVIKLDDGERIGMVRSAGEMQREDAARARGSAGCGVPFDQVPDLLQRRSVVPRKVQRKIPEA